MLKVDHIGIAVKSLEQSIPLFEKLLQTPCYKRETVTSENVTTAFFQKGETKLELLESTAADGVIVRRFRHYSFSLCLRVRTVGCCATCGCSAPAYTLSLRRSF